MDHLVSLAASDDRLARLLEALAVSDDQLSRLLATNASTAMIGTHDRAVMAAEREVEREARQSAASAELEARGGSGGQSRPSVGAVAGAGVSDGACAFGVAKAHTERKVLRVADSAEIDELETGLEVRTYGHEEGSPTAAPASNAVSNRVTPKGSSNGSGIRDWHPTNALAVSTCAAASPQASNRSRAEYRSRAESSRPCQEQSEGESCSKPAARQQEKMVVLAEVVPRDATSMSAEGKPSTPELAFHGCDAATVAPVGASAGSADIQCEHSAVENTNSREHSSGETGASVTSDAWPPRWMMLLGGVI